MKRGKFMKKFLVVFVVLALLLSLTVPAFAAKPDVSPGQEKKVEKVKIEKEVRKEEQKEKQNGAEKYEFFLSGDVMPSPPYGLSDVEGSDEKSKLIVNQPNGKNVANVTGVLKGLIPDTEYTVFISDGYMPFMPLEVNFVGEYLMDYRLTTPDGASYPHSLVVTLQNEDGTFEGYGVGLNDSKLEEVYGTIIGNSVTIHSDYVVEYGGALTGYYYDVVLTIDETDGSMEGTWISSSSQTGYVYSEGPVDISSESGDIWWPGLLTPELPAFTVMTDEEGHVSWHVNILCEMIECIEGEAEFSVWINGPSGTVLISETVVLECGCEPDPEVITDPE